MVRSNIVIASCCLGFLSSSVFAASLLERLELATEEIGKNQGQFYVSRVPELADKMPSWDWDDEIRTASKCMLDGISSEKGAEVAEAYVAGLELEAAKEITSFTSLSSDENIPAELKGNDSTIADLQQRCGTIDISINRLKESGLWDALIEPSVMQRLIAE